MQNFEVTTIKLELVLLIISSYLLVGNFALPDISNEDSAQPKQPHIIVIIADDLGWNDVSFHGSDQIPTPNIDALAANGIALNRYYVQPTCTPSRTAFLTGRYPLRSGMQGFPLKAGERWGIPLETRLLPKHLRDLGYTTRLLGKWHVGYYSVDHTPTHRGFDSFFGYYSGYIKYFDHTISQRLTPSETVTGYDLHRDTPHRSDVYYDKRYFTDLITQEVETIIESHDVSKPLYLQVAHLAPHSGETDEPLEVWNVTEVNEAFGYIEDENRRLYAGMVSRLDSSVGRIVRALSKTGMLENSIIIFTADNGAQTEGLHANFGSNFPLRGLKFSMFDGGVRGVGCVYSPLIKNGGRLFTGMMHITDWMPTLYSAAGGDVKDLGEIDGFNQWPSLMSDGDSVRESLLLNIDEKLQVSGAVSGDFKLLMGHQLNYTDFYGDSGIDDRYPPYDPLDVMSSDAGQAIAEISDLPVTRKQILDLRNVTRISCPLFDTYVNCTSKCLFDMVRDPCETVNVADEHPEIVERMERYITSYLPYLIPQSSSEVDPASSPDNSCGVWEPWVESTWKNVMGNFDELVMTLLGSYATL